MHVYSGTSLGSWWDHIFVINNAWSVTEGFMIIHDVINLTWPYLSVVSCVSLTTGTCHLFRYSTALFSWLYLAPVMFSKSVIRVVLDQPRDIMPSIFPSISCSRDVLCLTRCPRYCNFLVLNYRTISLIDIILLNTLSLLCLAFIIFVILCDNISTR